MGKEGGRGTPHARIIIGVALMLSGLVVLFQSLDGDSTLGYLSGSFFLILGAAFLSPALGQLFVNAVWKLGRGAKKQVRDAAYRDICMMSHNGKRCGHRVVFGITGVHDFSGRKPVSKYAGKELEVCIYHHPWKSKKGERGELAHETAAFLDAECLDIERVRMIPRIYG